MTMVGVGAFLCGRYVFRDGFADAGWRWGEAWYYLAIVGLVFVLWVVPTFVDLAVGNVICPDAQVGSRAVGLWVFLSVTLLLPSLGAELGWRGYLLPHLFKRMSHRKAILTHGAIWSAWHLPLLIGIGVNAGMAGSGRAGSPASLSIGLVVLSLVLRSGALILCHSVIIAYIWKRSGSLALAAFYHALYFATFDALSMTLGLGGIASLWASIFLVALGAVLLCTGKWQPFRSAERELPPPPRKVGHLFAVSGRTGVRGTRQPQSARSARSL
jgi:membrane protease YdiL (CAAX protease family)